jgi:hypothetical protein
MFGTSGNYLNSLGFNSNQGLRYGPWGDCTQGTPYQFIGALTGLFGALEEQGLVALGAWASDGSVLMPPPSPPPSPPSWDAGGFDVDELCPQISLIGSGIDYFLMENQVGREKKRHTVVCILAAESQVGAICCSASCGTCRLQSLSPPLHLIIVHMGLKYLSLST